VFTSDKNCLGPTLAMNKVKNEFNRGYYLDSSVL